MMKKQDLADIIAFLFVVLFVYTAINKLADIVTFRYTLGNSPLIGQYAGSLSWAVPITELVIASMLLVPAARLAGLCCSSILMAVFTIYISYMLLTTPHLPCSCGGIIKQMGWKQHLVFNATLFLLGLLAIRFSRKTINAPSMQY